MNSNRTQWERDLLGILANHKELIDRLVFSRDYFGSIVHARFYDYLKEYKELNIEKMSLTMSDDEIEVFVEIYANNIYEKSAESMMYGFAELILEDYKMESINALDDRRKLGMISSDEYYVKLTEVKNLTCESSVNVFTSDHIDELISDDGEGILIDKFYMLSRMCRINKGDLVTIAAVSGFGKSAFLLNVYQALSQNKNNVYKCHYFNIEVGEQMMVKRLLAITADKRVDQFNKNTLNEIFYKHAREQIVNDSYIEHGSVTLEELKAKVLNNMDEEKINIVFVDHIGLLDTDEKAYNRTEYDRVTYCMKELRKLALDNNLIIFIASQFDRASVKDGKLSMHSLKSSGEIENSSTHVLLLQKSQKRESDNPKTYEEVLIDVAKNRNGSVGALDTYTFYKEKQVFVEAKY